MTASGVPASLTAVRDPASILGSVYLLLACAGLGSACVSNMHCQRSSEPLEAQECVATGSGTEAAVTAVAAGGAWAAQGCRVNGCNLPYACDDETGFCERIRCGEGEPCPAPFECDLLRGRCH